MWWHTGHSGAVLGHLGVVFELLGVVVLVERVNETNEPSFIFSIYVDTSSDYGILRTKCSNLFNWRLELPN